MRRATFCVLLILTVSCSPKIAVSISESFPAIGWKEYSGVMDVKDSIPANAQIIGSFVAESNNSNYRLMYLKISEKAREAGGNVVKLDSIYYAPFEGFSGKSRLYGDILHIDNTDPLAFIWEPSNTGDVLHLNTKPSPYKYELSIGSAGEPYYAMDVFPFGVMDIWYHGTGSLEMLNSECYDVLVTPTASVEFAYHINANFAIIGSFGCSQARVTYYDPFTESPKSKEELYMFDLLAGLRLSYYRNDFLCCYSQLQFGATAHTPGTYWNYNEYANSRFGWQVTALGLSFGKRLFGSLEFGWGSEYCAIGLVTGSRIGIGYKF